jgi:class 3 adenylate cyclase/predicted ATPase/ribosomal protein L40E
MECVQCGADNPERAKFCIACATPFSRGCAQCGTHNPPQAKFCAECGAGLDASSMFHVSRSPQLSTVASSQLSVVSPQFPSPNPQLPAERRQLTVMFCDLVGSTALSAQLDPEDLRAVVRHYQQTCAEVIQRHDGYIAQFLGDGLLVYFGYPTAHEDDARRAVWTGLEIIEALRHQVFFPSMGEGGAITDCGMSIVEDKSQKVFSAIPHSAFAIPQLQVRIGIHTGLVVIGDIGSREKHELLALGETPNIAARLQGLAEPNTVIISAATQRLIEGQFDSQPFGSHLVKGIDTPISVYHVHSERQSTAPLAWHSTLTPLVGREEELALLQRHWELVKDREGQVALLSGEPGIGKSRLVRELRERVEQDGALCIQFRCSPYHQNSALQPAIEHLQRVLHWQKDDTPQTKTAKLQSTFARYRFPQADTLALFAALLSLPQPADAAPLNLSPQRQKQKTEEALIAWLIEEAERAPLYCVWEDLHWADPSTLELLGMLIDQTPTSRLFVLLTSRPEFTPPWGQHAHFSQLTLSRLGRRQVPQMIALATGGKTLPAEVVQQIVAKTDGVPLFVEELTKMVLESGLLTEANDHYKLTGPVPPLAIPSTLQDSLMARLDRLASVRELAQLGATIGREFSYELLHAVSPLDEQTLQHGLQQLVGAELIYQRGTPPQASYFFKHALIQDIAYQSLLKSRRQQLHQQIVRVLEDRFPDTNEAQPELLAHHYTEAGRFEQAITYWQQAGKRASERSAYVEAINHLTKGLGLLKTLPDTPERSQQELLLQLSLGPALIATRGNAALEVEHTYRRAQVLCQRGGDTQQLFPALFGLRSFYVVQADVQTAHAIGEQLLDLAERTQEVDFFVEAHVALGATSILRGDLTAARASMEQALAYHDLQCCQSHTALYGIDPGVMSCSCLSWVLQWLGYPDQARNKDQEALDLAQQQSHPFSQAVALNNAAVLYGHRREVVAMQRHAEALLSLASAQGFPAYVAVGTLLQGVALAAQGQRAEGITQAHQGLTALRVANAELPRPFFLVLLAETCGRIGEIAEGLQALEEVQAIVDKTGAWVHEAELYRLRGELLLQQSKGQGSKFNVEESSESRVQSSESEAFFFQAIDIARKQQAKSWELRAATSLARLWQAQGKAAEAHKMLSEVYNWFTEGFDTKDLREAKALIEELSH